MENLGLAPLLEAFRGQRVFLTGHTGFKGSWLTMWLNQLGAQVYGYSLAPPSNPSLFSALALEDVVDHTHGDVTSLEDVRAALRRARPSFVFHLAAQPLVRASYAEPLATIHTNVYGSACVLEAIRLEGIPCTVVVVTSDKCYENTDSLWGYREDEPLGGHDVYSTSKAVAELIVASYRRSFFPPASVDRHGVCLATVRAGNVIGGGDWGAERLIPDVVRAVTAKTAVAIRNPAAVRPWQHVLEPLSGYLLLAARLAAAERDARAALCGSWNFGPTLDDCLSVRHVVDAALEAWGSGSWVDASAGADPHEARMLRLNIDKAQVSLGWRPRWRLHHAMQQTMTWYRAHFEGAPRMDLRSLCLQQIDDYSRTNCS